MATDRSRHAALRAPRRRAPADPQEAGLGAGKINAPGGRIEAGESALAAALREVHEEVGVTVHEARDHGTLSFQFTDGYGLFVHVFSATSHEGEPHETEEAIPRWTAVSALPFDEMWQDDAIWLPHLLAGRSFTGRFVFEGDQLLDHELEVDDSRATSELSPRREILAPTPTAPRGRRE